MAKEASLDQEEQVEWAQAKRDISFASIIMMSMVTVEIGFAMVVDILQQMNGQMNILLPMRITSRVARVGQALLDQMETMVWLEIMVSLGQLAIKVLMELMVSMHKHKWN